MLYYLLQEPKDLNISFIEPELLSALVDDDTPKNTNIRIIPKKNCNIPVNKPIFIYNINLILTLRKAFLRIVPCYH